MTTSPFSIAHHHGSHCWWNPDQARWSCDPASFDTSAHTETADPESESLVDVRDMIVVHTALLREFRLTPAAVARTSPDAANQVRAIDRHLGFLCDLLHHHHQGEDELLWPLMRERVSPAARAVLDDVEAQHTAIDSALHAVGAARLAWVGNPTQPNRDALTSGLTDLHLLLKAHLDLEEQAVLPLAASVLSAQEWHAVGDAAAAAMPKPTLLLAFGMFAYEGDPAVLRTMLASAPPVPRFLVPRLGPRLYARRARAVHGTVRP